MATSSSTTHASPSLKHVLRGNEVAVVTVWPCRFAACALQGPDPHSCSDLEKLIASAQDERILNEKRRHRDRPFERVQPMRTGALEDLDLFFFEKSYLPAAFAPDVLDANERSLEQRLTATKMIVAADTPTPTVLGILVLGNRPRDFLSGAYIQFLRVAGKCAGRSHRRRWLLIDRTAPGRPPPHRRQVGLAQQDRRRFHERPHRAAHPDVSPGGAAGDFAP